MSNQGALIPALVCCASCGASVRPLWRPFVDGVFASHVRCPSCKGIVCSFYSESGESLDDLLPLVREHFPSEIIAVHFRRPSVPSGASLD